MSHPESEAADSAAPDGVARGQGTQIGSSGAADPVTHRSIDNVTERLRVLGATGRVVVFPDSARTAQQAADQLGCEVGAIANSLIFDAGGKPVLILTSGAHRVDTTKVATDIGVRTLRRAAPEFVRDHTGQAIGGVAPIGHPSPIPTYLDRALRAHAQIWAAAGHPHAVFSTTYDELRSLTDATEIDVETT
ncbi:MAG: YbaK/EbsC family protein [Nocardioidaceae bacterium]